MQKIIAILVIAACALLVFVAAQKCQECQSGNSAYCHDQTSYRNCMQNNPIGDIVTCDSGYVCSNTEDVCVMSYFVDGSSVLDVCGPSGGNGEDCAVCSGSNKYSCVSETQFARCVDQQVSTANVYSCGTDEICVIEALATHGTLCVPTCAATFLNEAATCSNREYVAPPDPTVPTVEEQVKACEEAGANSNYLYFFTRYIKDMTCNSYLYCEKHLQRTSPTGINREVTRALLRSVRRGRPCRTAAYQDCSAGFNRVFHELYLVASSETPSTTAHTTTTPLESTESSTSSNSEASSETPSTTAPTTTSPRNQTETSTSSNSEASSETPSTTAPTTTVPLESTESSTSSISVASSETPSTTAPTTNTPLESTESSTSSNSEASSETPSTTAPTTTSPLESTESSTSSNSEASSETPSTTAPTTTSPLEPKE
ncbi:GL25045 [Drosophila persimilis]|uniref:GL25045 n=1 Tax=Drosophila persimilis TaxID=7234 RepID=B4GR07_DROPE|nr:GL25045 [Drosophila persimilis]